MLHPRRLACCLLLLLAARTLPAAEPAPAPPQPLAAAQLPQALTATGAKLVVVNLWATWCIPCRQEFPHFVKLRQELQPRGVEVLFLSCDFSDEAAAAAAFLAEQRVTWRSYLKQGSDEALIEALNPAWSGTLPATFIYDAHGKQVAFWEGPIEYPALLAKVQALLPQ
jgi:thiol-disulfide isomerase/thioredoxin